ncbi:MAG: NnrU family protein [Pseudomonadota bacterium]
MLPLILGLLLWTGAHLMKRIAPGLRASLGDKGKGVIAVMLFVSLALMVIGYRGAEGPFFWGRSNALVGINNLLMLLAVYLFAISGMKTALARKMRHPMLAAVKVWALAHLLVNGDLASFVLFGGLLAWAVAQMIVINKAQPEWTPPPPAPMRKEGIAVGGSLVVFIVIALIHGWLGYNVFGLGI